MLSLADVDKTIEEVRQHLENGAALKKFEEMVVAQGGDLEDLYRPVNVAFQVDVLAERSGTISALPALEFGLFAMKLGAGRAVKTDELDYESGIVFAKKVGQFVEEKEKIAIIFSNIKISDEMLSEFQKNVKIEDVVVETKEILEIVS